jgi:(p)ppGpp synthase/HD superfamily hydrolase
MIQERYQKAMKFAGEKHCHQQVPGTVANYLLHLANVSMEILLAYQNAPVFDLDFAVQLAILHDIIEDTDTSYEELKTHFGQQIATGVLALTKNQQLPTKAEQMTDSLTRINQQPKEVGMVKLADRITNLQQPPHYWSVAKMTAYRSEAKLIASSLTDKNEYLHQRLLKQIEAYKSFLLPSRQ